MDNRTVPLALCSLLVGLAPLDAQAALPAVAISPASVGPTLDDDALALELSASFSEARTAYGANVEYRSKRGWMVGGGLFPLHRNSGPQRTTLGVAGRFGFGYAPSLLDIDVGPLTLDLAAGARAFGEFASQDGSRLVGGGALVLGLGARGSDASGLELVQIFGEYRPVVVGKVGEADLETDLHNILVGGQVIFDLDRTDGLYSGLLFRAALTLRALTEGTTSELQAGIGLVL